VDLFVATVPRPEGPPAGSIRANNPLTMVIVRRNARHCAAHECERYRVDWTGVNFNSREAIREFAKIQGLRCV
jgi:hypothetical protein